MRTKTERQPCSRVAKDGERHEMERERENHRKSKRQGIGKEVEGVLSRRKKVDQHGTGSRRGKAKIAKAPSGGGGGGGLAVKDQQKQTASRR